MNQIFLNNRKKKTAVNKNTIQTQNFSRKRRRKAKQSTDRTYIFR